VIPTTTRLIENAGILRFRLKKGQSGIARDSDLLLGQVIAAANESFRQEIGSLPNSVMEEVENRMRIILGIKTRPGKSVQRRLFLGVQREMHCRSYVEGKTIILEVRWDEAKSDRWAELAGEIVRRKVDVILAGHTAADLLETAARDADLPPAHQLAAPSPVAVLWRGGKAQRALRR
jgi:hypothetical protein